VRNDFANTAKPFGSQQHSAIAESRRGRPNREQTKQQPAVRHREPVVKIVVGANPFPVKTPSIHRCQPIQDMRVSCLGVPRRHGNRKSLSSMVQSHGKDDEFVGVASAGLATEIAAGTIILSGCLRFSPNGA